MYKHRFFVDSRSHPRLFRKTPFYWYIFAKKLPVQLICLELIWFAIWLGFELLLFIFFSNWPSVSLVSLCIQVIILLRIMTNILYCHVGWTPSDQRGGPQIRSKTLYAFYWSFCKDQGWCSIGFWRTCREGRLYCRSLFF